MPTSWYTKFAVWRTKKVSPWDCIDFLRLDSNLFTRKWTKTSPQPRHSVITTITMKPGLNSGMQVSETWDVFVTWSQCSSNSSWPNLSGTWFWWLMTRNHKTSSKEEPKKLMITFSTNSKTCLQIFNLLKNKSTIQMNFVLPSKTSKANQSMSPFNKMLKSSSTFSSTKWKKVSREHRSKEFSAIFTVVKTVTWQSVQTVMLLMSDTRTFTRFPSKSKVINQLRNLSESTFRERWFRIINVIHVRRKQMSQKAVTWPVPQTTLSSIWQECVSIMISLRTKKSTADGSSLTNLTFGSTLWTNSKETLTLKKSTIMNLRELSFIMVPLTSDITSLTSRKAKINGLSSTTKGSESMIQETLKQIVSVDKIGEENPKTPIFWSLKKSKRDQLSSNSTLKKINNMLCNSLDWKKLSFKLSLSKKKKKINLLRLNLKKKNLKFKFPNQTSLLKNPKYWLASIPWKFQLTFRKTWDKKFPKPTKNSHSRSTYQTMNSRTSCTRFSQSSLQMNSQLSTSNSVTNASTWNKS